MHPNARKLRAAIATGKPALGTFLVEFTGAAVVNVVDGAGFDFLMIDCEHGSQNPDETAALIEAAWCAGICVLVRTPHEGRGLITRALDAGAGGVLIPFVQEISQVHQAVRATKYPPLGRRGVHLFRGHTRHRAVDPQTFMAEANRDLLTLIQIELASAVEISQQIAATEGVDGLYVGPGDLSVDLGVPGQWDAPVLTEAILRVAAACRKSGKIFGCHVNDLASVPALRAAGVQMFGYSCDIGLFGEAVGRTAEQFRRRVEL
jgi:2-keto-3-deoxy-L-rhamnonate aldolase RhmA